MPVATNPKKREFYVYYLEYGGVPFYVGLGRDKRGTTRVEWISYLISREKRRLSPKWARHCTVAYKLDPELCLIKHRIVAHSMPRKIAEKRERQEIDRLLARGRVLANVQHNPERLSTARDVVIAIKAQMRAAQWGR